MPKKKNEKKADGFGYDSFSQDELKDTVVRLWKEIEALQAEKKDINKSINESVKELKERVGNVVYWIGVKQTELDRKSLEAAAEKALKS